MNETISKHLTVMGPKHAWFAMEAVADNVWTICRQQRLNSKWGKCQQQAEETCITAASHGTDVQDTFLTLPNTGDVKDYRKVVDALNAYFAPKVDTTYARHCFRQLVQAPGETIRQFATRLRRASKDCDYGEDTDNQIRDEILCKCTSTYIKWKLLEECQELECLK